VLPPRRLYPGRAPQWANFEGSFLPVSPLSKCTITKRMCSRQYGVVVRDHKTATELSSPSLGAVFSQIMTELAKFRDLLRTFSAVGQ
jgi:hypothetical protein